MMHERTGSEGFQLKPRCGTGETAKIENERKTLKWNHLLLNI